MADKIPSVDFSNSPTLPTKAVKNSLFFVPSTEEEVAVIISLLQCKKQLES